MAKQIPSSPSNKKISELLGMMNREELILQPSFQRKLVWNDLHKDAFIDTILKGYPFPEIYIAQSGIDVETLMTQQVVVDGQQRLSTIKSYVEGSYIVKQVKPYGQLSDDEKKEFLNYDVVVRDLKDASPDTIKEVFRRINQTSYNLNQVEINNAIYDGAFITTAKNILDYFIGKKFPIFSESDISRMGDLGYVLLLMTTIAEGGYFSYNKEVDVIIEKYNNEFPGADDMCTLLYRVIEIIAGLELPDDSIWYRKSNFFTLFIETSWAESLPGNFKERLESFSTNIINNKGNDENDFGKYYAVMFTGTNSRTARITRSELFRKYVLQS